MEKKDIIKQRLEEYKNNIENTYQSIDRVCSGIEPIAKRYSPEGSFSEQIKNIKNRANMFKIINSETSPLGDTLEGLKEETFALIDNIIFEIDCFDENISNSKSTISVVNNNSQEQKQSIDITFILESLKATLTDEQLSELKNIQENEPNPNIAKPLIVKKLKSFGENLTSNILANILTNPLVWQSLI